MGTDKRYNAIVWLGKRNFRWYRDQEAWKLIDARLTTAFAQCANVKEFIPSAGVQLQAQGSLPADELPPPQNRQEKVLNGGPTQLNTEAKEFKPKHNLNGDSGVFLPGFDRYD